MNAVMKITKSTIGKIFFCHVLNCTNYCMLWSPCEQIIMHFLLAITGIFYYAYFYSLKYTVRNCKSIAKYTKYIFGFPLISTITLLIVQVV